MARRPASLGRGAILCIIDGLTDESFRLDDYPHLYALAQSGAYGAFDTVPPGFAVESYPCISTLLGLPAAQLPPLARGYLEALGAGISLSREDFALRASWMQLDELEHLVGPADSPGQPLLPAGCAYYALGGYKALLTLSGAAALLPRITTFAPHSCVGWPLAQVLPKGDTRLTEIVRLSRADSKVLIPWGQSACCKLPGLSCRAAAVGAALIFKGLTQAMGLDFYGDACFSGDIDTDLAAKTRLAMELTKQYPLVLLHINGADEAAHRQNIAQKRGFARQVDDVVVAALQQAAIPVLICCDHGTSPLSGRHMAGEQPFILTGTARRGSLGRLPGNKAIKLLVEEVTWQKR